MYAIRSYYEYQQSRKPNADAIAELSYRNFMEMSSKTADDKFHLQKKIEKWFSEKHPDKWAPLYSRVTFSHQPYAEALAEGDKQNAIMQEILAMDKIEEIWDTEPIEHRILDFRITSYNVCYTKLLRMLRYFTT